MNQADFEKSIRRATHGSVGYQIVRAILMCIVFVAAVIIGGLLLMG